MFRAGDLKMINDFSRGELCPLPPVCSLPPSRPRQLVYRGRRTVSGGGVVETLPVQAYRQIRKKMQGQERCIGNTEMSYCCDFILVFSPPNSSACFVS